MDLISAIYFGEHCRFSEVIIKNIQSDIVFWWRRSIRGVHIYAEAQPSLL